MTEKSPRTLLAPGNQSRWEAINEEEDRQRRESASVATVEELLRRGQHLSSQAAQLRRAVRSR